MKKVKLGAGFTVFILFFGVALLDALRSAHWLRILFWVAIGLASLLLDNFTKIRHHDEHDGF